MSKYKTYVKTIAVLAIITIIIFVLISIFGRFKITNVKSKLAAHGVPMTPQELAAHYYNGQEPTITTEELEILEQELQKIEKETVQPSIVNLRTIHQKLTPGAPTAIADKSSILEALKKREGLQKKLDEIFLATPTYKVKRAYGYQMYDLPLPEISLLVNSAITYALNGHLALDENDTETALVEYAKIRKLITNLSSDHTSISLLVALGCDNTAEKLFIDMVLRGVISKEQLADIELQNTESEKLFFDFLKRSSQMDAASGILFFEGLRNKYFDKNDLPDLVQKSLNFFYNADEDLNFFCRRFILLFDNHYLEPSKQLPDTTPLNTLQSKSQYLFSNMFLVTKNHLFDTFYRYIARIRMRKLICAIEIFKLENAGNLPRKLADLKIQDMPIDPFSGTDFIFLKKDGGYILYSIGTNKFDDGGNPEKNTDEVIEVYIKNNSN